MNLCDDVFAYNTMRSKPFMPKEGLILSGAGQCTETIAAMQFALGDKYKPAVIALYESIGNRVYCPNTDIVEAGMLFPGAILQIGLQLPTFNTQELLRVADGTYDSVIRQIADNYKKIALPILLRIGYEYDGTEWNGYDPEAYIKAYNRIADIMSAENADNVAFVWDSYTINNPDYMMWFPGDKNIDWYGYNTLSPKFYSENVIACAAHAQGKPVMSGEASFAQNANGLTFDRWIKDYFKAIRNTKTHAYQYINWRWELYAKSCGWSDWMDGRFTENPEMIKNYFDAMHGDDMVYRDESYAQPISMIIDCARGVREGSADLKWNIGLDYSKGASYTAEGFSCCYGDGFNTHWKMEKTAVLRIKLPEGFTGELVLQTQGGLTINGTNAGVQDGYGHIHYPVTAKDNDEFIFTSFQTVRIVHVYLIETKRNDRLCPIITENRISWRKNEKAYSYRIYKNYQLYNVTFDNAYIADDLSAVWHISASDRFDGMSEMERAIG